MKAEKFDQLTRVLAAASNRRQVLTGFLKGIAGGVLGFSFHATTQAAASFSPQSTDPVPSAFPSPPLCADDYITLESIDAAQASLDAGAEEVPLGYLGCIRYRRKLKANNELAYEAMFYSGKQTERWIHTTAESNGFRDGDQDGFFEWRSNIVRGASVNDQKIVITQYSPATQSLFRRETYTRTANTLHVFWEEFDPVSGVLSPIAKFDTNVEQASHAPGSRIPNQTVIPNLFSSCSADQEAQVRKNLAAGAAKGTSCLRNFREDNHGPAIANGVDSALKRKIVIVCDDLGPDTVAMLGDGWQDPLQPLIIKINNNPNSPAYFFLGSDEYQQQTLFHELLHTVLPPHRPGLQRNDPRYSDGDRVEACTQLCFGGQNTNQCQCATCLNTVVCDKDCQPYHKCSNERIGAICPCPLGSNALRFFPSCTECLATCPSGLACFGFGRCIPVDVSCNPQRFSCP